MLLNLGGGRGDPREGDSWHFPNAPGARITTVRDGRMEKYSTMTTSEAPLQQQAPQLDRGRASSQKRSAQECVGRGRRKKSISWDYKQTPSVLRFRSATVKPLCWPWKKHAVPIVPIFEINIFGRQIHLLRVIVSPSRDPTSSNLSASGFAIFICFATRYNSTHTRTHVYTLRFVSKRSSQANPQLAMSSQIHADVCACTKCTRCNMSY